MRTQVAIIGAGPAGLTLGRLLRAAGVDSIILEAREREYVEQRVRAGLLEPGTVDVLEACEMDERLRREGMLQEGFELRFDGTSHRVPVAELTGRCMTVYGQSEVVKDLIAARLEDGDPLLFGVSDVVLHEVTGSQPHVTYSHDGREHRVDCDIIAGCDGFHGVARAAIPAGALRVYEHVYPFGWLGVLIQAPPPSDGLVYARHPDGFALIALRTPEISRLYVQCTPDEDVAAYPDDRVWATLRKRLATGDGFSLDESPVLEKGITQMRSFLVEPMQHGRLFLAGDAAHIVPPTGAKGLNLAVSDVKVLAEALGALFRDGDEARLREYSATCLRRVWRTQRFSWLFTSLLHRFPGHDEFERRVQLTRLEQIVHAPAAARAFAESYIGASPG